MILGKSETEDIFQRIDFIQIQLGDLKRGTALNWETYSRNRDVQRNVERLIENVANAAIDICKIIIAGEETEMPNSYRDIIIKLGVLGILDEKLAGKIAEYAGFRNFLAHRYLDLKWDRIRQFINDAPQDFDEFLSVVSKRFPK